MVSDQDGRNLFPYFLFVRESKHSLTDVLQLSSFVHLVSGFAAASNFCEVAGLIWVC